VAAVNAWVSNGYRGSIIYSTGTGKTEIAFECAKRRAIENFTHKGIENFNSDANNVSRYPISTVPSILFLVPRIILIEQNVRRLLSYHVPEESIGVYFGERKEVREITISTYQSVINNLGLIHSADTIVFDDMHLLTDSAKTLARMFYLLNRDEYKSSHKKALL
jgi:superfamily II DNA or RNA helicase